MAGADFVKPVNILADASLDVYKKPVNNLSGPVTYKEIADEAIYNCKHANPNTVNEKLIWKLIEIEKKYNLPNSLRGLLLAAACHESGYNTKALGDRKFSKKGKAMAVGLFQMWPWWEKRYKINRSDAEASAHAYLTHVVRQLKGTKKRCKYSRKQERKLWLASWATAIRAPKKDGRCGERPKFYKILRKWHKEIKHIRQNAEENDGCGC